MRILLFTLSFLFILASCSKDVRYTNKVNGSWNIEEISDTHATSGINGTLYFNNCDILDDDFRMMREDYSYRAGDSLVTVKNSGAYKFTNGGKTLLLRRPAGEGTVVTSYTVSTLTKTRFSFAGDENGVPRSYTLQKAD